MFFGLQYVRSQSQYDGKITALFRLVKKQLSMAITIT
jgi:hypothetical protein